MSTLRRGYGPLLLLLYQTAPLSVQQDSLGKYRVTIGYATGQWENDEYGCSGELLNSTPVQHHSIGAQVDIWPNDRVRLTAFGGSASQSVGETFSSDSAYSYADIEPFAGRYGGAQFAYEGQKLGLGIGITRVSSTDQGTYPAIYARFGNIDEPHLRMDAFSPDPAFPSVPWGRIGVGINTGHLRSVGGFFGVGLGPPDYNTKAAFVGAIHFPIAHRLTAQLHGLAGPGETHSQWSFGTGLQFDFGARH